MKASELAKKRQQSYKEEKLAPPPKIFLPGEAEGTPIFLKQRKHRLTIIGGMPGAGKTAYTTIQTALSLSEQGFIVLICTYEMHEDAIIDRLWSNGHEIPCNDIDDYKLTDIELDELAADSRLNCIFITTPRTVSDVHKYINENIYADPDLYDTKKPEVVIIWDYLQRIPFHSELSAAKDRVSANLQDILSINNTLDVHSIVLASLNREGYHLTSMEAFKEAGDIESDTDMAVIMRLGYQKEGNWVPVPKELLNQARKNKQVNIIFSMVKNRHGAEVEYVMGFDKTVQKFRPETYDTVLIDATDIYKKSKKAEVIKNNNNGKVVNKNGK
ncbi:MAG: DnaB-like helicase C-terminal domain-containing protein [Desulfuromonadaceae bacterium]|nr:DnaB-like helicase C-terminal domain-containing protein [Desulfuromonadaceae bacterium]